MRARAAGRQRKAGSAWAAGHKREIECSRPDENDNGRLLAERAPLTNSRKNAQRFCPELHKTDAYSGSAICVCRTALALAPSASGPDWPRFSWNWLTALLRGDRLGIGLRQSAVELAINGTVTEVV
ncbi:hypothetical protein MPLSOD_40451 [Mesorhizobium sp. SOD10]|nr:hypothetical protein MPLSOD_40451 [Mesorhizobium sp. SOD10]